MTDLKTWRRARNLGAVAIGFGLICTADPGQSQALDPAAAIKARKTGYGEIGAAFKSVNDELRKPKPLAIVLTRATATISKTAVRIPNWFPAGSGPELGVKTAAKPDIWKKRAEFDALQRKFVTEAATLDKLAAVGDMKTVAAQAKVVGATCKACHDKFRTKED
jgi:cytochrome c556